VSPLAISLISLAVLYVLGREIQHYGRNTRVLLTPSRCEHFLPDEDDGLCDDEGMDTFAAIWNAAYAPEELEALRLIADAYGPREPS
jgi:hypothetical protein